MNTAYYWMRLACWSVSFCLLLSLLDCRPALALQPDTALAGQIKAQLQAKKKLPLYFPRSVKRFYGRRDFKPVWLISEKDETGHAWQAMMLLDCVLQYGLSHADYHPDELTYGVLHDIVELPGKISAERQARFELMLTDAMLTLMAHLHYGKLNPELPALQVDAGRGDMHLETVLAQALSRQAIDETLLAVQPKGQAYQEMQRWMHKWKGQYLDDCYEVPEASVRKVAINMERLRWAAIGSGPYLQVNIPSFTLSLFLPDTTYQFKIVAGRPATPTPLLQSRVFAIDAPAKTVWPDQLQTIRLIPESMQNSALRFAFSSHYNVSLKALNGSDWFRRKQRALTRGDVGIENADKLAALLLSADHQGNKIELLRRSRLTGKAATVSLHTPMPIKITYLTCWFQDAQLMDYPDIYQLDTRLEQAIYHELPKKLAMP